MFSAMTGSLHSSSHLPEREVNPPKMAGGWPCRGGDQHTHTHTHTRARARARTLTHKPITRAILSPHRMHNLSPRYTCMNTRSPPPPPPSVQLAKATKMSDFIICMLGVDYVVPLLFAVVGQNFQPFVCGFLACLWCGDWRWSVLIWSLFCRSLFFLSLLEALCSLVVAPDSAL